MQARQDVILYKRHSAACAVHKTKLPVTKRRFWFDCQCPIWIEGRTPAGEIIPRQSTGTRDRAAAESFRTTVMTAGSTRTHGPRVADCIEQYLLSRSDLDARTQANYARILETFRAFLEARSVFYMHRIKVDDLERFKTSGLPGVAAISRRTYYAKVRCFLRAAFRREWLLDNLADRVAPVKATTEQKEPYSDDEIRKIWAVASSYHKPTVGHYGYTQAPAATITLMLDLMLSTGLRISDVVAFQPALLVRGDKLWIYTFTPDKQHHAGRQRTTEVYLEDALKARIDACVWLSARGPFYGTAPVAHRNCEAFAWVMRRIGKKAGVKDCRPHRLRDTFAIRALLAGLSLEDVSRLLGHSTTQITELYYAKWVPARKRRLEGLLFETLVNAGSHAGGDEQVPAAAGKADGAGFVGE